MAHMGHWSREEYLKLSRGAMEDTVRKILSRLEDSDGFAENQIFLSFQTPKVGMPSWLRARYPEQMVVVLEHQYKLECCADSPTFQLDLVFRGVPARLTIPYEALQGFWDKKYQIEFSVPVSPASGVEGALAETASGGKGGETTGERESGTSKVVPLRLYREFRGDSGS